MLSKLQMNIYQKCLAEVRSFEIEVSSKTDKKISYTVSGFFDELPPLIMFCMYFMVLSAKSLAAGKYTNTTLITRDKMNTVNKILANQKNHLIKNTRKIRILQVLFA